MQGNFRYFAPLQNRFSLQIVILHDKLPKIKTTKRYHNNSFSTEVNLLNSDFEFLPRTFTISTNNGKYLFNIQMLCDFSPIVKKQIENNPNQFEFHIDIDDTSNVMKKFDDIFRLKIVDISKADLSVLQKIAFALEMKDSPFFENLPLNFTVLYCQIDMDSFNNFIRCSQILQSITIISNEKEYHCNCIGVYSSNVIKEILTDNPELHQLVFDVDKNDDFSIIRDLFNFQTIEIDANNIEFLEKISDDLQIDSIRQKIDQFNRIYSKAFDSVDAQHHLLEPVNELFESLYNIETRTSEKVFCQLIESEWIRTEENIQEMVACFLQVIRNKIRIHSYLLELIIMLDEKSKDKTQLKMFLPFFKHQILHVFHESQYYCAFLYRLVRQKLITFDQIMPIIEHSHFKNIDNILKFFIPEFKEYSKHHFTTIQLSKRLTSTFEDLEQYNQMRENFEPANKILRLIFNDDVDGLRAFINENNIDINQRIQLIAFINDSADIQNFGTRAATKFSIYQMENFDTEEISLIEYAALNSSINCYKYLLLNHAKFADHLMQYALKGGNFEIIRNTSSNFLEKCSPSSEERLNLLFADGLAQVITMHYYSLIDWILDQISPNMIDAIDMTALIYRSVCNGNIYAILSLMNKDLDITKYFKSSDPFFFAHLLKNGFFHFYRFILCLTNSSNMNYYDFQNCKKLTKTNIEVNSDYEIMADEFGNTHDNSNESSELKNYFPHLLLQSQNYSLFTSITNMPIRKILLISIQLNYSYLVNYILQNLYQINDKVDCYDLYYNSVQTVTADMYELITSKIESCKNYMSIRQCMKIIKQACSTANFEAAKAFTEIILKLNDQCYFTDLFLIASNAKFDQICEYLINQNVRIDLILLSNDESFLQLKNGDIAILLFEKANKTCRQDLFHPFINAFIMMNCYDNILKLLRMTIDDPVISSLLREKSMNSPFVFAISKLRPDAATAFIDYFGDEITKLTEQINLGLKAIVCNWNENNSAKSTKNNPTETSKSDSCPLGDVLIRLLEVVPNVDLNYRNGGNSILTIAVQTFDSEFINYLLNHKSIQSSLNEVSADSPFVVAIAKGNINTINLFIDYFGDEISKHNEQINLGLQIIFNQINNNRFSAFDNRLPKSNLREKIFPIIQRFTEFPSVDICLISNIAFLQYAINASDIEIFTFCLKQMKIKSIPNENLIKSLFVYAISVAKSKFIYQLIEYCGDDISSYSDQINLGLQSLIDTFDQRADRNFVLSKSILDIIRQLQKVADINLDNYDQKLEDILAFAIKRRDVDLVQFCLDNIKPNSLLNKATNKSPFILAIQSLNLNIIDLFIAFFGDKIQHTKEQIDMALQSILSNLVQGPHKNDMIFSSSNQKLSIAHAHVLKRLSQIVDIDLSFACDDKTFLTLAISQRQNDFITFVLENFKHLSASDKKAIDDAFLYSITALNLDLINAFIDYYDDKIINQTEQINLTLKSIFPIYFENEFLQNANTGGYNNNYRILAFRRVIHRLLEVVRIDFNFTCNNETLLTYAIKTSDSDIINFYLNHFDDHSMLSEKSTNSPLVCAIRTLNFDIINLFIDYFTNDIDSIKEQIQLAVHLLLEDLVQNRNSEPKNKSCRNNANNFHFIGNNVNNANKYSVPIFNVLTQLFEVVKVDLNYNYKNENFLTIAIKESNTDFVSFYLKQIKDNSIFDDTSQNSPFVCAIRELNLDVVNLFIEYFGNNIKTQTQQISLGIELMLKDLEIAKSDFKLQSEILKRLSEVVNVDLSCSLKKGNYLLNAINKSDLKFTKFCLENLKDHSILDDIYSESPFVLAIRKLNNEMINMFIKFLGDEIIKQTEQINLGMQLILVDLYNKTQPPNEASIKYDLVSIYNIVKQLSKLVDLDLTCSYKNETFLTFAVRNSDLDFVKLYLSNLKNRSIINDVSSNSPFAYAIKEMDLDLLNVFIDYFRDEISLLTEQINAGLKMIVQSFIDYDEREAPPRQTIAFTSPALRIEKLSINSNSHNKAPKVSFMKASPSIQKILKRLSEITPIDLTCSYNDETLLTLAIKNSDVKFIQFYLNDLTDHSLLYENIARSPFAFAIRQAQLDIVNAFIDYFGEHIKDQSEQINEGLQNNLADLCEKNLSFQKSFGGCLLNNDKEKSVQLNLVQTRNILNRLSEVIDINLNYTCNDETFISIAIQNSDMGLIRFYLENVKDHSLLDQNTIISPFIYAIKNLNVDAINLFIQYYGDKIVNQYSKINTALNLLLMSLYDQYVNLSNSSLKRRFKERLLLISNVLKIFADIPQVNFNQSYRDQTFLSLAIETFDTEFIKFYLNNIKDPSIYYRNSSKSPFVLVIRKLRLDIINIFIQFYGDEISNYTNSINQGLKLILQDFAKSNSSDKSTENRSTDIINIVKRLSEVANIDLNSSYQSETFLTFAVKQSDFPLVNFCLANIKDSTFLTRKAMPSPLVIAIRDKNIRMIKVLIPLYKDDICLLQEHINFGLKLVLRDLLCQIEKKSDSSESKTFTIPNATLAKSNFQSITRKSAFTQLQSQSKQSQLQSQSKRSASLSISVENLLIFIQAVIKNLLAFADIDLNCSYDNETFLTIAIRLSNANFIKFYLNTVKDHSLLKNKSAKSPLVLAIKTLNIDILNVFIEYFGDDITKYTEQINFGLQLLLQDICDTSSKDKKSSDFNFSVEEKGSSIINVIKRLSEVVNIDLNYSYRNETFFTIAVKNSYIELIHFHLTHVKDSSIINQNTIQSAFVLAIRTKQMQIINLFIEFFGDNISKQTEQINLGLQYLIQDLVLEYNTEKVHTGNQLPGNTFLNFKFHSSNNDMILINNVISRLSEVANLDLSCIYGNEALLTIGMTDLTFLKFYLSILKKNSNASYDTRIRNAFLSAIKDQKLEFIDEFIEFFGENIQNQNDIINEGIQLSLKNLCEQIKPGDMFSCFYKNAQASKLLNLIKRFSQVTTIDLNYSHEDETFLTIAMKAFNTDIVKIYLENLKDRSYLAQKTEKSPLILAIREMNLDIINLFISYLGDDISKFTEQLNFGLTLILKDLYCKFNEPKKAVNNTNFAMPPPIQKNLMKQILDVIKRLSMVTDNLDLFCHYKSETFLTIAIRLSDPGLVSFYLENIKDYSQLETKSSKSPIVIAIKTQKVQIINLFITYFGDKLINQVDQINLGLQLLLKKICRHKLQTTLGSYRDNTAENVIKAIVSSIPNANIDCDYNGETFLSQAVNNSNSSFVKFYLDILKEHSNLNSNSLQSAFVLAIEKQNLDIINLFIDFYGHEKINQAESINSGLQNILIEKSKPLDKAEKPNAAKGNITAVIKRLFEICDIDFTLRYNDITFLTVAVNESNTELLQFCLKNMKDFSILKESSMKSPFVTAIVKGDINIINLFIDYFGETISDQSEQIQFALSIIYYNSVNLQNSDCGTKVISTIQRLCEVCPIDLNRYYGNNTFLTMAVNYKIDRLVQMLVSTKSVDVNLCELEKGNSPLMIAVQKRFVNIAQMLLECPQIDLAIKNLDNQTAFDMAFVNNQNIGLFNLMLKIFVKNVDQSLLNRAFYFSDDKTAKDLIQIQGLNVNYKELTSSSNSQGLNSTTTVLSFSTSLVQSLLQKQFAKAELIINHQTFDPIQSNAKDAVFLVIEHQNYNIFNKLLEFVDVNQLNNKCQSLLYCCCKNDFIPGIDRILNDEKFDIHKSDFYELLFTLFSRYFDDGTVLSDIMIIDKLVEYDQKHSHIINFSQLLPNGKSFYTHIKIQHDSNNIQNANINTFAKFIASKSNLNQGDPLVKYLIDKGVDPNKPDSFGIYPLQYAMVHKSLKYVQTLINSTTIDYSMHKINYKQIQNGTYLHLAAFSTPQIIKELLELNLFDIEAKDDLGQTPKMIVNTKLCLTNGQFSEIGMLYTPSSQNQLHEILQLLDDNSKTGKFSSNIPKRYQNPLFSLQCLMEFAS